jgi:hypothetical protein
VIVPDSFTVGLICFAAAVMTGMSVLLLLCCGNKSKSPEIATVASSAESSTAVLTSVYDVVPAAATTSAATMGTSLASAKKKAHYDPAPPLSNDEDVVRIAPAKKRSARADANLDPRAIDQSKFVHRCSVCGNRYEKAADLAIHRQRRGHSDRWNISFDELKIGKVLGEGAFGVVKLAEYCGETVAVKMLKSFDLEGDALSAAEALAFSQEAELMRKLPPHPNVIQLVGIVSTTPTCIITQFAANGSLESFLKRTRNQLQPLQRLTMCKDAASAIIHLHRNHLVHRDIAARNFLIDTAGSLLITDFGLTRAVMGDSGTTKTRTGPLRYMAPESLHRQEYSTASDAWAFGVLMWEIESGAMVPYGELSLAQTAMQVCMEGLRLAEPPGCVPGLHELMMLLWITEVSERCSVPQALEELVRLSDNHRSEYWQ